MIEEDADDDSEAQLARACRDERVDGLLLLLLYGALSKARPRDGQKALAGLCTLPRLL